MKLTRSNRFRDAKVREFIMIGLSPVYVYILIALLRKLKVDVYRTRSSNEELVYRKGSLEIQRLVTWGSLLRRRLLQLRRLEFLVPK